MPEFVTGMPYKRVLNVGCGPMQAESLEPPFRGPDWHEIRLDIDADVLPDIIADVTSMPQVLTGTFDAVQCQHNLEHLFSHEVDLALKEFLRVLKPGGFVYVVTPDLQQIAELVVAGKWEEKIGDSPSGPISAIDAFFGHRKAIAAGREFMAHRTGFCAKTLGEHLAACGFLKTNVYCSPNRFELVAIAHKSWE